MAPLPWGRSDAILIEIGSHDRRNARRSRMDFISTDGGQFGAWAASPDRAPAIGSAAKVFRSYFRIGRIQVDCDPRQRVTAMSLCNIQGFIRSLINHLQRHAKQQMTRRKGESKNLHSLRKHRFELIVNRFRPPGPMLRIWPTSTADNAVPIAPVCAIALGAAWPAAIHGWAAPADQAALSRK